MAAIHPERGEVELVSGEIVSADVFVGADGDTGVSRETVVGQRDRGTPVGMSVIRCVDIVTLAVRCSYTRLQCQQRR